MTVSEHIDVIAVEILQFLASDEERLERFLRLTGLTPQTLREAATSDGFATSIVSYLAQNESELMAFAANAGHAPETIAALAQRLGAVDR